MFLIFHRSFYTTEALAQRSFYRQTPLHREAFTERDGYTQHFSQRDALTRTSFHMQKLFHTDAVTRTLFQTEAFTVRQVPLHTKASTQKLLRRCCYTATLAFAPGCFHRDADTQRSFYADQLLGTEPFTHDASTRKLVHREASTHRGFRAFFTHRRFYTKLLQRSLYKQKPFTCQTNTSTHRSCCTQKLLQTETCILRTEAFTQRSPCRQMLFTQKVTEAIAHRHLFHTEAFTRRDRYKLQLPQTDAFTLHTKAFTQKKLLRTDAATRGHFSTQRPCYTTKF